MGKNWKKYTTSSQFWRVGGSQFSMSAILHGVLKFESVVFWYSVIEFVDRWGSLPSFDH
jgi:hypothetical protein